MPVLNFLQPRTRSQLALNRITEEDEKRQREGTTWTSRLYMLRDKHGNTYDLCEVYIRLYNFQIGFVRFAVCAHGAITQQALLDVQNSVMRLGDPKQAGCVADGFILLQSNVVILIAMHFDSCLLYVPLIFIYIHSRMSIVSSDLEADRSFEPRAFITDILISHIGQEVGSVFLSVHAAIAIKPAI